VKPLLAACLIADGHTAFTPRTLRMWHSSEAARLLAAAQQHRIIVTHNRKSFLPLHDTWRHWSGMWQGTQKTAPLQHAGILIIPQTWQPLRAAREIDRFLQWHPAIPNQLYEWAARRGWLLHP
jgi:hypothetical protein